MTDGGNSIHRSGEPPKTASIYARVSTGKQAQKEIPIQGQLDAMRKYASEEGYVITGEFVDRGISAKTTNRPEFQRMMAEIKSAIDPVDVVLIWSNSRLARNKKDALYWKGFLRSRGIELISMTDNFDVNEPEGDLMDGFMDGLNEYFGRVLSRDVKRGMRTCAERGFFPGSKPAFGYRSVEVLDGNVPRRKLAKETARANIVKRMFKMADDGMGLREIANVLNREGIVTAGGKTWGTSTMYQILTNEVYLGDLLWNRTKSVWGGKTVKCDPSEIVRIKGCHEAIIDNDTFDRVQAKLKQRSPKQLSARVTGSKFLLAGIVHCKKCGATYGNRPGKSSQYHYYCCRTRTTKGAQICNAKIVPKTTLEDFVVKCIETVVLSPANLSRIIKMTNEEIELETGSLDGRLVSIEDGLKDVERRLDKWTEAFESSKLSVADVVGRINQLNSRKSALEEERARLSSTTSAPMEAVNAREVIRYVKNLDSVLDRSTIAEQKAFLKSFIERIDIDWPTVEISYRLPRPDSGLMGSVPPSFQSGPPPNIAVVDIEGLIWWWAVQESNL